MAKQTFTTGQVLTAAQMTSLQQTAMGGGDTTAKTASYVLVAADAGTTVAMNAAGATTITVNTGLFAAGDTVFIQNRGAGVCTVTAGTATVACAGSLALPQNDAGILYFTSASAAIFYDWIQVGATSPLTTKGDLYGYSTSDARIPIGTNGHVLTADSTESLGLKWAAPAGGSFVGCKLKKTAATFTVAHNTATALSFDSEEYDTDTFHDNSTNNTRITIPAGKGGKYLFVGTTRVNSLTSGDLILFFAKNGTQINVAIVNNPADGTCLTTEYLNLTAGDYIELKAFQNSGSTKTFEGTDGSTILTSFSCQYLGA